MGLYTIGHVADAVGVSTSTLRAWERRYGVVASRRTEAGYRLYDAAAIEVLRAVQTRIEGGQSVREAVAAVRGDQSGRLGDVAVDSNADPARVTDTEELLSAAVNLDALRLRRLLQRRFAAGAEQDLVGLLDGWLLPAMLALGQAWESGRVSVSGEHLVANAVMRRLGDLYESLPNDPLGPRVMIGLPANARHELGLLAFACLARAGGVRTSYLGADLPAAEWGRMVREARPDGVVLALSMRGDAGGLEEVVAAINQGAPRSVVAVGGAEQDLAPESCLRLGHGLQEAVLRLRERL